MNDQLSQSVEFLRFSDKAGDWELHHEVVGEDRVKAIVIVDHGSTVLVVRTEDVGHQRVYRYSKIRQCPGCQRANTHTPDLPSPTARHDAHRPVPRKAPGMFEPLASTRSHKLGFARGMLVAAVRRPIRDARWDGVWDVYPRNTL